MALIVFFRLLILAVIIVFIFVGIPWGAYMLSRKYPESWRKSAKAWFIRLKSAGKFELLQTFYLAVTLVCAVAGELLYLSGLPFADWSFTAAALALGLFVVNAIVLLVALALVHDYSVSSEAE